MIKSLGPALPTPLPPKAVATAATPVDTVESGQPLQTDLKTLFSARKFSNIQSSPDGSRLAYVQNGLRVQQPDGSEKLIYPGPVSNYRWLTDDLVVFGYDKQGNERWNLALAHADGSGFPDAGGGTKPLRRVTYNPEAVHHISFFKDGQLYYRSNARNGEDYDLYRYDLETRQSEAVLQGQGNFEPLRDLPDGRILINRSHSNVNNDLVAVDPATGQEELLTPHTGNVNYTVDSLLTDHELLVISNHGREFHTASVLDLKTRQTRPLFESEWDVEGMSYQSASGRLACVTNEDGYSRLKLFDVRSRTWLPCPPLPDGVVTQLDWSGDQQLRFVMSAPDKPNSFGEIDVTTGQVRWLKEARFAIPQPAGTFVKPELVHYPSFDGTQIPALLYRAHKARPDQPEAVVVQLHGGPEAQTRPKFDAAIQHLVDQGISVLAPNVRGSTGYGRSYLDADNVEKRPDAIADVKHAAPFLRKLGFDANRIGVMGGSYGGYLSMAALAFAPEENWAAAVSNVGMSNLETFMQNTGAWRRQNRAAEYGDPVKDADVLRRWSPMHAVQNMQAPLLVIQGANDARVPRGEADQMVDALRQRGQEVDYLLFGDEGHGMSNLNNVLAATSKTSQFLKDHLLKSGEE